MRLRTTAEDTRKMQGKIEFRCRKHDDIHIAHPKWTIETDADCKLWFQRYADYHEPLGQKVDTILLLDDLFIGKGIGSVWGRHRADMVNRFTPYSIHVHANAKVSTHSATSAVLFDSASMEAPTVAAAIQRIGQMRQRDGV